MISMVKKFVITADVHQDLDVIWETYNEAKHVGKDSIAVYF